MMWHLNELSTFSSENIEPSIILMLEIFTSHKCSNFGIIINLFKSFTVPILFVFWVHDVICCTALVFLASIKNLSFDLDTILFKILFGFHTIPSHSLFLKPLLSQIIKLLKFHIVTWFSSLFINYCKVFIKSISLYKDNY